MKNAHPSGTMSWIVYGPQGCGKTRNALALANALKLNFIQDDWTQSSSFPLTDHLILTQDKPPEHTHGKQVMSFKDAMKLLPHQ